VLPELTPPAWKPEAKLVAAPAVIRQGILVPLVPLLKAGVVTREHIVVNSFSRRQRRGKKSKKTSSTSSAPRARRRTPREAPPLAESKSNSRCTPAAKIIIQFNPHLAPMRRGIATTITVPSGRGATIDSLYAAWRAAYGSRRSSSFACR